MKTTLASHDTSVAPSKFAPETHHYLKAIAVMAGTGAAFALAKTTGAWSWIFSGFSVFTTKFSVPEEQTSFALQPSSPTLQTYQESDARLLSPLKPLTTLSASSRPLDALDSLNLVELDQAPPHQAVKAESVSAIESEEAVIELSTEDGERVPAGDAHLHGRQLQAYPLTDEFRVNTYVLDHQRDPWIARLTSGEFVVTWASTQDGDGSYGIYGQRYSSTGVAQGAEFRVNTYTLNYQGNPSIAALTSGDFVVAWESDVQDGNSYGVYAQRYSSTGAAQGAEFRVNTYTTNYQGYPSVAGLTSGDFVVAWTSTQDGDASDGVYAQRYSSAAVAQGAEFRVNTYTTGNQVGPRIAALTSGDFVVAWQSAGQDGSLNGIYAQRYSSLGAAQGAEFRVNTYTSNQQEYPNIAALTSGDFVVTWQSLVQDGNGYGVYAQRYSSAGAAQGPAFRVNTYTSSHQEFPRIAALTSGDFVVTWQSNGQDGDQYGVYAQRYSPIGVAQGAEFRVNTYTTSFQSQPSIAALNSSDFAVAWHTDGQDGSSWGVYARLISSDNLIPVLAQNQLTLTNGETVTLNATFLNATDADIDAAPLALNFIVSDVAQGQFELSSNPGVAITEFTQGEVQGNLVRFVHDGNNLAPSYQVRVSDGVDSTVPASASVLFTGVTPTQSPSSSQTPTVSVTSTQSASLSPTPTPSISFTPSLSISQTLSISATATQSVSLSSTSSVSASMTPTQSASPQATTPSVSSTQGVSPSQTATVSVSSTPNALPSESPSANATATHSVSPAATITTSVTSTPTQSPSPQTAPTVTVTPTNSPSWAPIWVNRALTVREGERIILTPAMLSVTDSAAPDELIFTVNTVQHGQFEVSTARSFPITQFTAQQIAGGQIEFIHDGEEAPPVCNLSVSNAVATREPIFLSINYTPVNDAPRLNFPIASYQYRVGEHFSFTLLNNLFTDPEGEAVTLSAQLSNGEPLPRELTFDPQARKFTGFSTMRSDWNLTVIGSDPEGLSTEAFFNLRIIKIVISAASPSVHYHQLVSLLSILGGLLLTMTGNVEESKPSEPRKSSETLNKTALSSVSLFSEKTKRREPLALPVVLTPVRASSEVIASMTR